MNRWLRTFFIFLLLLSSRTGFAATNELQSSIKDKSDSYAVKQAISKDLFGLISISSLEYHPPRQFSTDFDALYSQAQIAQTELTQILKQISTVNQIEIQVPAIKSYSRAREKVSSKLAGDASLLTDLARASIITSNIHDLVTAYEALTNQAQIIKVKNRFASPKDSGYRDLNVLIRLPKSKMIAEIQLHLSEIANIKNGAEHQVYEQVQSIEMTAMEESRGLNDFEQAQVTHFRQVSHKQYHKTWLQYKRIDAASVIMTSAA
ncbi:MAG: RelA/SpoT domain-containing protein [Shewanella sp.]